LSALPPLATEERTFGIGSSVPIADQVHGSKQRGYWTAFPNVHNPRHSDDKRRTTTGLALNRNVTPHHLTESSADHEAKSGTDWKIGRLRPPPGLPPIRTLDDIQGRARSLLGQEHNPAEGGDKN
jgi:hypothetical protein